MAQPPWSSLTTWWRDWLEQWFGDKRVDVSPSYMFQAVVSRWSSGWARAEIKEVEQLEGPALAINTYEQYREQRLVRWAVR